MKKLLFLFFCACFAPLYSQHLLTIGPGFSHTSYDAKDMQNFSDTYNVFHQEALQSLMQGIGGSEGIKFEIGYRYIDIAKTNYGVIIGYQAFNRRNNSFFANGEYRDLKLTWNSFYTEFEMGRTWNIFFLNGLLAFNLKRELQLESQYYNEFDRPLEKSLNGIYKNNAAFSTEAGLALGYYREWIYLSFKVTYHLFTTDRPKVFVDNDPEKVSLGIEKFPNDFYDYYNRENYDGISNEFNKLRFSFSLGFAIPLTRDESSTPESPEAKE